MTYYDVNDINGNDDYKSVNTLTMEDDDVGQICRIFGLAVVVVYRGALKQR